MALSSPATPTSMAESPLLPTDEAASAAAADTVALGLARIPHHMFALRGKWTAASEQKLNNFATAITACESRFPKATASSSSSHQRCHIVEIKSQVFPLTSFFPSRYITARRVVPVGQAVNAVAP